MAMGGNGMLYVTDGKLIRQVTLQGAVTTVSLAGNNPFNSLGNIAIDAKGNFFVIDNGSKMIYKVTPGGVVTAVAGTPSANSIVLGPLPGALGTPVALAFDRNGDLYVTANNAVLKVPLPQ
jgi:hypothetical protein